MKKILIYAGTTEGRTLAEMLAKAGLDCEVCVATEYGEQVMKESPHVQVRIGRLDIEEMKALYEKHSYFAVIDATHPFATIVTANIRESLRNSDIPLFCLSRSIDIGREKECHSFETMEECLKALEKTEGRILLTTGSKELYRFCKSSLLERLVVRVLPGKESIDLCYKNGLEGKQIVAMQGPFSKEMNLAMIHQYNISCMVTKESGKAGGMDEKIAAAKELQIPCFIIRKPESAELFQEYTIREICEELQKITGIPIIYKNKCQLSVVLAGIGMGTKESITGEVKEQIAKSDYLFGAKRMIQNFVPKIEKYPYFIENDIVSCLEKIKKEKLGKIIVTVLFSGDTGFYSGCEKLYQSLHGLEDIKVSILPGISTISALAAKVGISWQDAQIVSTHGIV